MPSLKFTTATYLTFTQPAECGACLKISRDLFMRLQTQKSTCSNPFPRTSIHPVFVNSKCQLPAFCRSRISCRTCFWVPLRLRKSTVFLIWHRQLVWKWWNGLLRLRSVVVYLGDHTVGTEIVRNTWILTAFLFWKDNYLFRNPHSNLVILTHSYSTHTIWTRLELRFLLYSHHQLIFLNLQPTLLRITTLTLILPMPLAVWMSQSNWDWGGYVMDIGYTFQILLIHSFLHEPLI